MIKRSLLILATTFAAGLLFVNVYTSLIDSVNWGSNIPASIQATRDFYKAVNPGDFFRIFSPINQVLSLLALIACRKVSKRIRAYCALALLFAVLGDVFTFAYFYPRNEIMFMLSIENIDAIKKAWSEWTTMNWLRSGVCLLNLAFDFAALTILLKENK